MSIKTWQEIIAQKHDLYYIDENLKIRSLKDQVIEWKVEIKIINQITKDIKIRGEVGRNYAGNYLSLYFSKNTDFTNLYSSFDEIEWEMSDNEYIYSTLEEAEAKLNALKVQEVADLQNTIRNKMREINEHKETIKKAEKKIADLY